MDQYSLQLLGGSPFTAVIRTSTCRRPASDSSRWRRPVHRLWHRTTDLIELLHSHGAHGQLVSDLLPLLRAGDLLDEWFEHRVVTDRNRYHTMRKTALETIADSRCTERRTS